MRPLKLTLSGFRSYRNEVSVDFAREGLVAIVGDTGAGKSSLLEAITYALYNATTWERGSTGDLRAKGSKTMSVTLEFECSGERYRITRSSSERNYPPAIHLLECITNPQDANRLRSDRESEIRSHIKNIVGLDYDGFLSAVLLPQGRFQTLLLSTRAEKTAILKGVLQLDALERVRDSANRLERRLRDALTSAEIERAQLLPDPAREIVDAQKELRAAEKSRALLMSLKKEIDALASESRALTATTKEISARRDRIAAISLDADAMNHIASLSASLTVEISRQESLVKDLEVKLRAIQEQMTALDLPGVSRKLQSLGELETLRPRARELEREIATLDQKLAQSRKDLTDRDQTVAALNSQRVNLQKELDQIHINERNLMERQGHFAALTSSVKSLRERGKNISVQIDELTRQQSAKALLVAEAEKKLDAATAALRVADEQQLTHAAHVLRSHLKAGQECPVCQREVKKLPPKAKDAPKRPNIQLLRQEESRLARELTNLRADDISTRTRLNELQEELSRLRTEHSKAKAELTSAGVEGIDKELKVLAGQRTSLEKALSENRTHLHSEQAARARENDILLGQEKARLELKEAHDQTIGKLHVLLDTVFPGQRDVTATHMRSERTRLEGQVKHGEKLQVDAEKAEAARDKTTQSLEQLHNRQELEVNQPLRAMRDQIIRLEQAIDLSDLAQDTSPQGMSAAVPAAITARDTYLRETDTQLTDIQQRALEIDVEIEAKLWNSNLSSLEDLDTQIAERGADVATANRRIERAHVEAPRVNQLEAALTPARLRLAALRDVDTLLSNSRFVEFVITRKEMALLGVASTILQQVSGSRFGFSENFQIADVSSGEPRDAHTLSGGELFQASLSLALALVELTGRNGGVMGSLFLDEGFGSLDASTLDCAIDALEKEAETGKLVVVVSHLQAVAERIDQVLEVTRDSSGSSLPHWLTDADHASMAMERIGESLLR